MVRHISILDVMGIIKEAEWNNVKRDGLNKMTFELLGDNTIELRRSNDGFDVRIEVIMNGERMGENRICEVNPDHQTIMSLWYELFRNAATWIDDYREGIRTQNRKILSDALDVLEPR